MTSIRRAVPKRDGETVECNSCGWQGRRTDTDAGYCPECGDECYSLQEIYGNDAADTDDIA